MSNFSLKTIGLVTILGLSACGGDDSTVVTQSPPKEEPHPVVSYVTINGTAISRDILSDATVTARCKDDSGFKDIVTTDEKGRWEGQVKSDQLPCRLKVSKINHDNMTHYSVVFKSTDNTNINPFTDLVIAYKSGYLYLPSDLYNARGNLIDYSTFQEKMNNNNILLVKELNEKGYDVDPSTRFFTDIIDLDENILDNIKGLRIAIDLKYNNYLNFMENINKYNILIPRKVAVNSPVIFPNLEACKAGPSSDIYTNCSNDVLSDFKVNELITSDREQTCVLEKQGNNIQFTVANGMNLVPNDEVQESIYMVGGYYDSALSISDNGYKFSTYIESFIPVIGGSLYKFDLSFSKDGKINGVRIMLINDYIDNIDHSVIKFADEYSCVLN